jgi:PAS domain S-box-containing protein
MGDGFGGKNIGMNSRWTEITGLTKEQTSNFGWLEAAHPEDMVPTIKKVRDGLTSGEPPDAEYRVRRVDRERKWMRCRGSPRLGPSGEILRWYGSAEDIDDRKRLDEALRKNRPRGQAGRSTDLLP